MGLEYTHYRGGSITIEQLLSVVMRRKHNMRSVIEESEDP